ncbi:MAG: GyrI-like domain-containing protein [Gordonia sp. (in: high G+C Gram-positive bacteria)]|uniref:GyrI-like domain-containing protein n=1 Tax=Gordonia sp. (in: high G+C Gram-positive bacteria) TaxID=84139 RepID=UPI0039E702CB
MSVPLILRDDPFTEATEIDLPDGVPTVTEFAEAITTADLPSVFDAGFGALAPAGPVGPGYALYSAPPNGIFDLEIGFPVVTAPEGFTASTFPAGRALILSHLGGYDGLGDTWGRLMGVFADRAPGDLKLLGEIYVTDPSVTAAADMRTNLFVVY